MLLTSSQAPAAIHAVGVDVSLGGVPIVRGVDLDVAQGEAVAIVGNNGSGKTTLMRALLGLVPHHGLIELYGTPLEQFRDRARIGYVPQRSGILVQQATVREVVSSGTLGRRRPFSLLTSADKAAIAGALDKVGLSAQAGAPFVRLSGGQQQRVLIARALASGATLMIWDEPLAGVDKTTQRMIAGVVGTLAGEGMTVVMVLHELGPLAEVLDRTVLLQDGRIVPHQPDAGHHHGGHEVADLARPHLHDTGLEAI